MGVVPRAAADAVVQLKKAILQEVFATKAAGDQVGLWAGLESPDLFRSDSFCPVLAEGQQAAEGHQGGYGHFKDPQGFVGSPTCPR